MANWELGVAFPPKIGSAKMKSEIMDTMMIKLCKLETGQKSK